MTEQTATTPADANKRQAWSDHEEKAWLTKQAGRLSRDQLQALASAYYRRTAWGQLNPDRIHKHIQYITRTKRA
ncbi:MAG: hypothetical protein H7842_02435 [Gammaproteobacteria bacterium SHHR-1]